MVNAELEVSDAINRVHNHTGNKETNLFRIFAMTLKLSLRLPHFSEEVKIILN